MPLTQADRVRGGINSHRAAISLPAEPVSARSAADLLAILEGEINVALGMARSVQRGRLIGFLARVALDALGESQFEERLRALESRVNGPRAA
jgi:hypothetical protein